MHVMIAEPEKEDLDLRHIFQEFRLIILENYKQFLTDFFAHFTSKQLIKVLEHYAFLLPMHPFNLKFILY